ncbi:MAG: hypothetical protein AABX91_02915 [Nanoarchaeota archaeon]
MKTLTKILFAGSVLLAGCDSNRRSYATLTAEDFEKAEWISVPYKGEIWGSYLGEDIVHGETNLAIYEKMVAQKNGFEYLTKNGKRYIIRVKGKEILLPDLDKSCYVINNREIVECKRNNQNRSYIAEEDSDVK